MCTVDTESILWFTLYIIGDLLLQPSIESRDVAQRTERHDRLCSSREGMRFNSAISSNFEEIIDMMGTQNEKIKAI